MELVDGIMKPQEDSCWIMCGRNLLNAEKIRALIAKQHWKCKCFHFVYDAKLLQKWYWKKMRGIANSKSWETVFLCWKGKLPKGMPRSRLYVDKDTSMYNDVVLKVPVVAPKDLTFVGKEVREISLRTMGGVLAPEPDAFCKDDEGAGPDDGAVSAAVTGAAAQSDPEYHAKVSQHVKRRRLYRQVSGTDVAWFPHDNAADVLKECVWEAGGDKVRWVLHGTPAAGAGVVGCLEMGASVVCMCDDAHHKSHFEKSLQEKCVEVMLGGSRVFKDQELQARAEKLCPKFAMKKGKKKKKAAAATAPTKKKTKRVKIPKTPKEDKAAKSEAKTEAKSEAKSKAKSKAKSEAKVKAKDDGEEENDDEEEESSTEESSSEEEDDD